MKKILTVLTVMFATSGFAFANNGWTVTSERPATPEDFEKKGAIESNIKTDVVDHYKDFAPLDRNYIFGTVGSTTGKKSSTAFSIGYGYETFQWMEGRLGLGFEGAYTRLNGKKLSYLNNEESDGKYSINKKNLFEVGGRLSYHFEDVKAFDLRLYGQAGVATTTFRNFKNLTPYVGAGVQVAPKGSPVTIDLGVKTYTNARNANITYKPNDVRSDDYRTSKTLTTVSLGVTYHF